MALEFTKKIPLGYDAPYFKLLEPVSGKYKELGDVKGELATVVMFICNHCPYVKHINDELVAIAKFYMPKGIAFVAINSNDAASYPEDAPDKMIEAVERLKYPFPYLFDETQEIARKYNAVCTPDFSIFNMDMKCVYRGQLDDSRPGSGMAVTGKDIRKFLDALIGKHPLPENHTPSAGCSIKWKKM